MMIPKENGIDKSSFQKSPCLFSLCEKGFVLFLATCRTEKWQQNC